MHFVYKTQGVCSTKIEFDVENEVVTNVAYTGGCNGNLKGISKLVEGMKVDDVISRLKGNTCGYKPTSCPDQLAIALEQAKAQL